MPPSLHDELRRHREARRVTQAELARRAGISQATVKAYERGARTPSARALQRIIEALGLPLDESSRLLSLAGLTFAPHWELDQRPVEVIQAELAREADECMWPAFVTNQSFDVVYANRALERLMQVDLEREYLGFGERNLVVGAVTEPFASQLDNWAEVMSFMVGLAKGDPRWRNAEPDQPAPWLQPMVERLSEGDPAWVRRLLDLWETAPSIPHRLRYRYRVRWSYDGRLPLSFFAVLAVADLGTELHWNEWVPTGEDDWHRLRAIVGVEATPGGSW